MRIAKYSPDVNINFPVGGGAILAGALLKRGATPGTDQGFLIKASGASATPDCIGILRQELASADATLEDGTKYTVRPIQVLAPMRVVRVAYDLTSLITCTQAVSTTGMTVTSLEDDIDAAFLYVAAGLGIGQTNYLTASAAGSCTLKAAFGTSLDTTSQFAKILPRFHQKAILNSDGTKLGSQAAVGGINVMILNTFITRNNRTEDFDPTKHAALTGLSSLRHFSISADVVIRDTGFYTID